MSKILRIVRLSFQENKVKEFLAIFEKSGDNIRGFEGNLYLELMCDVEFPNVYYTHSHWTSVDALESYRNSALFKQTWAETKKLFNDKPLAYSLVSCKVLDISK
jgi:hypothetical protein